MAAYFHGSSEIQGDGLQTLYLMNPNYVGYSDTPPQPPPNMLLLNSSTGNSLNPASISHAPPVQTQHLVGIPLTGAAAAMGSSHSDDPNRQSMHEIPAIPRFHYNLWGSVDQTPVAADSFIHRPPHTPVGVSDSDVGTHFGFRRPAVSPGKQGLSLSLSPQQSIYRSFPAGHDIPAMSPRTGDGTRGSGGSSSSVSAVSNGISGMQSMVLGSKYLQAAQQLLDEVVDVGKAIKGISEEGSNMKLKNKESMGEASSGGTKRGAELTTAERQELQMKKAKLVSMLDEVEQRYRQYHHQMQIVVTSFEQAAGLGSAKSYTSLALQTISKQFRCLKDAISEQIKATGKSLGEDDSIGGKVEGSRLKFVDHQLRQQRALQQLGMMQHNAWRPQRGLPERAVSVLRAWLFEHFLHPYPKDSDKHMLAKQTGLTRSQVSNWFINARVRLWKPMVEEMYLEEFKEQEQNASPENTTKPQTSKEPGFKSTAPQEIGTLQLDQINTLKPPHQQNPITQTASPTQISVAQTSPKKPRNDMQNSPSSILSVDMDMKPGERNSFSDEKLNRDGYHLLSGTASNSHGFGGYPMGELGRFSPDDFAAGFHGNGVSLTLGLPHCTQQNYLSTQNIQFGGRNEIGTMEAHYNGINNHPQASHSNNGYENINLQNRKRFATQLLHDFVA